MTDTSTADMILDAGITLLADRGPRAASVRGIAERAGVPPPTLQHHFPSKALLMRGLYARAADRHARATANALAHCHWYGGAPGLVPEIAIALLGEWRDGDRAATAVVLHMLAQAVRDPHFADIARDWAERSIASIAQALDCDADLAEFLLELLIALALTSAPGSFGLENDILNREFIGFLLGVDATPVNGQWRRLFRARAEPAGAGLSIDRADAARQVVRSALDAGIIIMAESGADALSYRTIAARASVAPSSILYNFPTRGALVMAIYNEIHRRFATSTATRSMPSAALGERIAALFTPMIVDEKAGSAPLVLASCELFLTAWWDADLAEQAWAMRLVRGTRRADDATSPEAEFASHCLSLWSIGLSLVQLSRHDPDPAAIVAKRLALGSANARSLMRIFPS